MTINITADINEILALVLPIVVGTVLVSELDKYLDCKFGKGEK
jgi:hypothetical protein